jgi:zinc protease
MRLLPSLLALLLLSVASLPLRLIAAAAIPFAHETSDLKPDPGVRYGALPNGLRYAILANKEPKDRASLRLLVEAGSFHEQEDQRGLAHFLEHMAFNGSKHYAPGSLVELLQRMGMRFGADTNASTGFNRTLYLLELPKTDEPTLSEGLRVFGDYATGLSLIDAEIDRERGIILSEKRTRDSIQSRVSDARFEFAFGSTLFPKRFPIGLPEVISNAPRERFLDFWNTWYRPERMAVIAVGDFDVALVEKLIVAQFSDFAARGPARADPSLGEITRFDGVRAYFHSESEMPNTSVSILSLTPAAVEPDTAANRLKRLPRNLALAMLNRRFSELAKKENAPFLGAGASAGEYYDFMRESSVGVSCKPEQWSAALAVGEQELRRALEHGFQAPELKEVIASFTNSLDQAVKTAPTRRSAALAGRIAQEILDRDVFTHPSADRALLQPALDKITVADCLTALRAAFSAPGRYVMVTGNAKIPGDANAAIVAAYEASRAVKIAAPAAISEASWGYADWGTPGKVAKRSRVEDLDITLVEFANGVRLNLKKTDFEAGRISLRARVGNGNVTQPLDQRGLDTLAEGSFTSGGLGKHSADELRRLNAGKNVGIGFSSWGDAFNFSGGTTPDSLLLELQLLTAYITDPGYRPEAMRLAQKGIEQMYLGFEHTANGPMAMEVANLIRGGDPRFGVPPKEIMQARNLAEVRTWLAPHFSKGAIELAIVGDLDVEATIAAVAATLGTLPPREVKPALAELKKVSFPTTPFTKNYTIPTEIPKGNVHLYWPTTDSMDIKVDRRLSMLTTILSDRLRVKIREEIGGTYSPSASSTTSDTFPGYGYIHASCIVDPAMAAKISDAIVAIGEDLATNGVTEDELKRARQPALTSLRQALRTNSYWLSSVLRRPQEKPAVLENHRDRLTDTEAITPAELAALAKKYLGATRVSRVTILPQSKS